MSDQNEILVSFENVQRTFDGETLVVKDLNLEIGNGEFLTLLGPSGSGKTTTLLMLAGFESITHGDILAGESLKNTPPYRRNIGMVFQKAGSGVMIADGIIVQRLSLGALFQIFE